MEAITAEEYKRCKAVAAAYRAILEKESAQMCDGVRTITADFGELGFLITYVKDDNVTLGTSELIKTAEELFDNLWEHFQNEFYMYHANYDPTVYIPYNACVITLTDELENRLELLRTKFRKASFPVEKIAGPEDLERLVLNLFQYKKLTDEAKKTIAAWAEQKVTEKDVTAAYALMVQKCRTPNFTYLKKCLTDKIATFT